MCQPQQLCSYQSPTAGSLWQLAPVGAALLLLAAARGYRTSHRGMVTQELPMMVTT
jgi:hypothetical protein